MLGTLAQLGLGFIIGFTGAAIPGPVTVFILTDSLSGGNKFHGVLAALGHCVVEAGIVLLIHYIVR
jgi:threonine/homoserine/homoserine lactone efflux protein